MQRLTSFIMGLAACSALSGIAQAGSYQVELNKTEIIYLDQAAGAIVVGNPKIADISVHSNNTLFVLGRGYGETNLLILDNNGRTIMNADIVVTQGASDGQVRLFKGAARETYSCHPDCQPSPILGDDPTYRTINSTEEGAINNTVASGRPAAPGAGPAPSNPGAGEPGSFYPEGSRPAARN